MFFEDKIHLEDCPSGSIDETPVVKVHISAKSDVDESEANGNLGRCTPSYIFPLRCVRNLFIGGVIYLTKKIIRCWYFICKELVHTICDGILHVNMLHYFKMPYITCAYFIKFTYNKYIGPCFKIVHWF